MAAITAAARASSDIVTRLSHAWALCRLRVLATSAQANHTSEAIMFVTGKRKEPYETAGSLWTSSTTVATTDIRGLACAQGGKGEREAVWMGGGGRSVQTR